MRVYLGLGSNLGDRREHLSRAIDALEADGATVARVSPVVESPALLPDSAPSEWNLPYLNLVLECTVRCTPEQLRARIDEIQRDLRTARELRAGRPGPSTSTSCCGAASASRRSG